MYENYPLITDWANLNVLYSLIIKSILAAENLTVYTCNTNNCFILMLDGKVRYWIQEFRGGRACVVELNEEVCDDLNEEEYNHLIACIEDKAKITINQLTHGML